MLHLCTYQCQAGGGEGWRQGIGRGFDRSLWPEVGHLNYLAVPGVGIFEFLTTNHFLGWGISVIFDLAFLPGVGNLTSIFGKMSKSCPMPHLPPAGLTLIGALLQRQQPLFYTLILVLSSTSLDHIPKDQSDAHELNYVYLPTFLILIFASAGISSSSSLWKWKQNHITLCTCVPNIYTHNYLHWSSKPSIFKGTPFKTDLKFTSSLKADATAPFLCTNTGSVFCFFGSEPWR